MLAASLASDQRHVRDYLEHRDRVSPVWREADVHAGYTLVSPRELGTLAAQLDALIRPLIAALREQFARRCRARDARRPGVSARRAAVDAPAALTHPPVALSQPDFRVQAVGAIGAEPAYVILFVLVDAPGVVFETGLPSLLGLAAAPGERGRVMSAAGLTESGGQAVGMLAAGGLTGTLGLGVMLDLQAGLYIAAGALAALIRSDRSVRAAPAH